MPRDMQKPDYPPLYLEGIRRFNERDFFEAHELLEDQWNEADVASRRFYQGLIQAAVALFHFSNGNLVGARKLYWSSREKLLPYAPRYLGLDVARFLKDMARCFAPLLSGSDVAQAAQLDPEWIATIVLEPPPLT